VCLMDKIRNSLVRGGREYVAERLVERVCIYIRMHSSLSNIRPGTILCLVV